jgi:pyridoxal 5'-phosphate synthase pdxT subunit
VTADYSKVRAGVLAVQGDFESHAQALAQLGLEAIYVKTPAQLAQVDVLCLPGGESTAQSLLLDIAGLRAPLTERIRGGMPVLATCAGAILLARELGNDSGSLKVKALGLLDSRVERNAYGRQVDSFEAEVEVDWATLGQPEQPALRAHFIRAPLICDVGPDVQVVARRGDEIILVRQGNILAATFHPELAGDARLHLALIELVNHQDTKTPS